MANFFRPPLSRWAVEGGVANWLELAASALATPQRGFHASVWPHAALDARRVLCACGTASAGEALWPLMADRSNGLALPVDFGLRQTPLWQLVMVATRAEVFTLARWCGACAVLRQVRCGIARAVAQRWRSRLGPQLYADVLQASELARWKVQLPTESLQSGRLLVEIGLHLLEAWTHEPQRWSDRRIQAAAGAGHGVIGRQLEHGMLTAVPREHAQEAVLAFVARHSHAD
jgi:hypothetical protein